MSFTSPRTRWAARLGAGLGLGALLSLLPRSASAQEGGTSSGSGPQITINPTVYRFYPGTAMKPYSFRAANLNPNDINFQDCDDDIILQFNLTISGLPTTDSIQVWAGTTDCSQSSARELGDGPYCWQVAPPGTFGNVSQEFGNIYARNITRYIGTSTAAAEFDSVDSVPGPGACHTQTTSGGVALTLYFLYMPAGAGSGGTPDSYATYGQTVDMVGPEAPELQLPIGIGDGLLLLNWTPQIDSTIQGFLIYAQDQGPNGLGLGAEAGAATLNTPVYCHPATTGTTTCPDAGAIGDSGLDATTTRDAGCTTVYPDAAAYTEVADAASYAGLTTAELASMGCERGAPVNTITAQPASAGSCTSTVLVDLFSTSVTDTTQGDSGITEGGAAITATAADGSAISATAVGISEIDASVYGVGNVGGNTTSSYTITSARTQSGGSGPLVNGHQYAIAVAAYDDDGNVGALSNLGCQTPAPVTDFFDKYSEDGGLAGGGFCSLEAPGAPIAGPVFGLCLGTALVAYGRRRSRRNRSGRSLAKSTEGQHPRVGTE